MGKSRARPARIRTPRKPMKGGGGNVSIKPGGSSRGYTPGPRGVFDPNSGEWRPGTK